MAAAAKLVEPVNPFVFKTAQSDRLAVARILAHAKKQGYKKLAVLTVSDGYGQAGREVLKEMIPAGGFELVGDEVYGPKDTDMTAQLTKLKGTSPDAVICWGTNPGPAVVAKNRVQLGIKTPLYMSHGVASKKFIELAGEAAEGLLLPAGKLTVAAQLPDGDHQKAPLLAYAKAYEDRFKTPASAFVVGRELDPAGLVAAETECRVAARGANCREVLRVTTGCGAVAHGGRDARLIRGLPFTPEIPISVRTAATAPTRDVAEREALAQCRERDRGASCVVAFAACVSPP